MSLIGNILNAARSPQASPVSYAAPGRYNLNTMAGASSNETYMRTMGNAGLVFQIVSMLSTTTAAAEWRLYRKQPPGTRTRFTTGDQGSDQRTEVTDHQALTLWNQPNPFMTGGEFREAGQQHMELCGEQFWVMQRAGASFPLSVWLVRPDRMEVVPSQTDYIAGYVYTGPNGEKVPLTRDEVVHIKMPNPLDPYRGLGPVQSVLVAIDSLKYSGEWNRNFYINSATVGGVIQVPSMLGDTDYRRLMERWREGHQGVARAHRVAVLENGMTFTPSQMSIKDMDFSNLTTVTRDEIRQAWGMHKSMLGDSEDVNRANAQTAEEVFGRWKIIPRLNRLRTAGNSKFLSLFYPPAAQVPVEFDYVNPLPDDREADNAELLAKAQALQLLGAAGADWDDALEVIGLPPMKQAPKPTPPPGLPQLPPADNDTGEPAEDDFTNRFGREVIRMLTPRNAADPDQMAAVDGQWRAASQQLADGYQQQIAPSQRHQLAQQARDAVAAGLLAALGALTLDSGPAAAFLLAGMLAYARTAAHQAASEGERAGAAQIVPIPATEDDLSHLADIAAALIASQLAATAGSAAILAAQSSAATSPDGVPDPDAVATAVTTALLAASTASLLSRIGALLSAAQNKSRLKTFAAGPRCELIASEMNDHNTCGPCAVIDEHSFGYSDNPDALAAADAAYPMGGYVACEGMERCRGTLTANWTDSSQSARAALGDLLTSLWKTPVARINGEKVHA